MTPQERARQIDQEEFRRDSERALQRALAYSRQKQNEHRRRFLILAFGEQGKHMDLDSFYAPTEERNDSLPVYTIGKQAATVGQWAHRLGISDTTLFQKADELGSMEAAIKEFVKRSRKRRGRISDRFEHDGHSLTRQQWADRLGVAYVTFSCRIQKYGIERAIAMGGRNARVETKPIEKVSDRRITHDGLTMTRQQWADHLGITYNAFCRRTFTHGIHRAIAMGGPQQRGRKAANQNTEPATSTSISTSTSAPGVSPDFAPSKETGALGTLRSVSKIAFQKVKSV